MQQSPRRKFPTFFAASICATAFCGLGCLLGNRALIYPMLVGLVAVAFAYILEQEEETA